MDLRSIFDFETKLHCKFYLLHKYNSMHDELVDASTLVGSDFTISTIATFTNKKQRNCKVLSETDVVTKSLQKTGRMLGDCGADLEILLHAVRGECDNYNDPFYSGKLVDSYVSI